MLNDSFHTYTWDNEGNPVTVDGNSLTYDALDRRVEYYSSSLGYVQYLWAPYDATKNLVIVAPAGPQYELPLPGGSQAILGPSGITEYRRANWQGSQVIDSTTSQTATIDASFSPYGEHDAENGYLGFFGGNLSIYPFFMDGYAATWRLYHYDQNRWISPDPAGLSAVDPSDPQTWNRYAYARGNPLGAVDPSGMGNCEYPLVWVPNPNGDGGACYSAPGVTIGSCAQAMQLSGGSPVAGCPGPVPSGPQTVTGNGAGTGLTKKQLACAADATVNGALSVFVPGYAAAKALASFGGVSFNPFGALAGTSSLFSGGDPTALQTVAGVAGANAVYKDAVYAAAGGASASGRVQALASRAGFGLQTASRQSRVLSQLSSLQSLEGAASFASKANNIASAISAGYDIYKCVKTP